MIYLIIALVLAASAAGWLGWRLAAARRALDAAERECKGMRKDRAIRQNLERMLDDRDGEIRRLRARVRQYEADALELENRASELNVHLFRESGLRILAEKEEGAKRMKMELMERQLDEGRATLRREREAARAREVELEAEIDRQQRRIEQLESGRGRRARRTPSESGLDQVTLDDLLAAPEAKQ